MNRFSQDWDDFRKSLNPNYDAKAIADMKMVFVIGAQKAMKHIAEMLVDAGDDLERASKLGVLRDQCSDVLKSAVKERVAAGGR